MSYLEILPWIFIVVGAFLNFLVPIFLKKRAETPDAVIEKIYVTKSAGLILVIIGCIMIFWLGGKFGV
ncbi:MAG: hypothetical protein J6Q27_03680 [Clostridia bacterium]|nr:hypothetical protein [Clostridia bacterium]